MRTMLFFGVILGLFVATPGICGINTKNDAGQLVIKNQQKLILEVFWPPIKENEKFVLPKIGKKQIRKLPDRYQLKQVFNDQVNNFFLATAGDMTIWCQARAPPKRLGRKKLATDNSKSPHVIAGFVFL